MPDNWSNLKRFKEFNHNEYPMIEQTRSLLKSIEMRFDKIQLLWNHFNEIKNVQSKELEIVKQNGIVNPVSSKLMAAIFEAILNEFYSINDNVAKILKNIYPKLNLPDSMSKLINRVIVYKIPKQITNLISNYKSYESLRKVRTESSHFSSGFIGVSNQVSYMSEKSGPTTKFNNNAILIENVENFYNEQLEKTDLFIEGIFNYLVSTLNNDHKGLRICGIYHGLLYQRLESYLDWKTQKCGICKPIWIINKNANECPLIENCKAYENYSNKINIKNNSNRAEDGKMGDGILPPQARNG